MRVEFGSDHDFEKGLGQFLRSACIDAPIEGDNSAECGQRIRFHRLSVSIENTAAGQGGSARVGMFHDNRSRTGKITGHLPGCITVHDVVIGEFLSLELPGRGDRGGACAISL